MKKPTPKQTRTVVWALLIAGAVLAFPGAMLESKPLILAGFALMVASMLVHYIFYHCPHCGAFLDRSTGPYCPKCGKKINE